MDITNFHGVSASGSTRANWLVTLIPAALFVIAIFVIGKYELSDEKMDEINAAITHKTK
jgi:Na+/melibiose symporter-like transporter